MIIGSGLIAHAFKKSFSQREDVCIYAAGVSNSACSDVHEFARERQRLSAALHIAGQLNCFVYFGTCSVADAETRYTPYVLHKLAMEQLAASHPRSLILRLPQVAGKTPNPHTLLNYLYAHIARSESFRLWRQASRNIIDVDDVAAIAKLLISEKDVRNVTLNIASAVSYTMPEIVAAMEQSVGKPAIYELIDRGSGYSIDTRAIQHLLKNAGVQFDDGYLARVIGKYYAKAD
jgi:nucleoside-diphosphate-sugar epimerase